MNNIKNSLKYSKYIVMIFFILIFVSLISARIIELSKTENNQSIEFVADKLKNVLHNQNEDIGDKKTISDFNRDGNVFIFMGERNFYNDLPQNGGLPVNFLIFAFSGLPILAPIKIPFLSLTSIFRFSLIFSKISSLLILKSR